ALELLSRADHANLGGVDHARWTATRARIELDTGNAEAALALLDGEASLVPVLEVRALASLALGRPDSARSDVDRALALAADDEERARVEALAGNWAHRAGESRRALEAFRRARDHAARAGALLEEATY